MISGYDVERPVPHHRTGRTTVCTGGERGMHRKMNLVQNSLCILNWKVGRVVRHPIGERKIIGSIARSCRSFHQVPLFPSLSTTRFAHSVWSQLSFTLSVAKYICISPQGAYSITEIIKKWGA